MQLLYYVIYSDIRNLPIVHYFIAVLEIIHIQKVSIYLQH